MPLKNCFVPPGAVSILLLAQLLSGCAAGVPRQVEVPGDKGAIPFSGGRSESVPSPAEVSPAAENGSRKVEHNHNDSPARGAAETRRELMIAELSGAAQPGDLVTVNYTATLEDGAIFSTTMESVAKDPAGKKVTWFREPVRYGAEEVVAGGQELLPGVGEAIVGMKAGEKKEIKLAPEQAFGLPDPGKLVQLPCAKSFPRIIHMSADDYVTKFSSFPAVNKLVDLVPYFKAKVTEVTEHDVAIEFLVQDGETFSDGYGKVTVTVADDRIITNLRPVIGAMFPIQDRVGVIAAADGESFTVDTNHPLAGKTILLKLELVSLTKVAALHTTPIDWIEEHDRGLARAKQEGKPVFLLLYADWCGWCKKTMTETIPDPRISRIKKKFVWVKINSDKETKFKKQYGQNGYPLMLVLNPDGTLRKRIDGYRDARGLKEELEGVL